MIRKLSNSAGQKPRLLRPVRKGLRRFGTRKVGIGGTVNTYAV